MGARVARLFRNINLENRVHREISKEKPRSAPRHVINVPPVAGSSGGECRMKLSEPVAVKGHVRLVPLLRVYVSVTLSIKLWTQFPVTNLCYDLAVEAADSINQKNDPLLTRLQSVYVESTDTAAATEVRMTQ